MGTSYYEDAKKDRFLENLSKEFNDDELDMLIVKFKKILGKEMKPVEDLGDVYQVDINGKKYSTTEIVLNFEIVKGLKKRIEVLTVEIDMLTEKFNTCDTDETLKLIDLRKELQKILERKE